MARGKRAREAAEEALRASEARFRALMENASDITTVITPDGMVLFDSPSIKNLLGYEPGELLGSNALELIHPDDVERTRKKLVELVRKPGELETMEHRLRKKDGRWRVFESKGIYLPEVAGIHGVVITARDITERIQAGLAMRRSERRYRRLFEAARDGILILHPATGDIIDANPFLIDMLGYSLTELLQRKLWQIVAFGDIEACKNVFVELRTRGYVRYDNLPLKTKLGNLLDAEFVCNLYNEGGRRVMQCNIRDISENRRMERLGLESEIAARMAEGVCLIRAHDRSIVYTNPRFVQMFGYARGELVGLKADVLNADGEEYSARTFTEMEEALGKGGVWEGDVHHRRKDGGEFWCHASVSAFEHPEHGRVWLAVCLDITERRETERMKDELITTVTHELRTPLTTLLGIVDLLQGGEHGVDSQREYLDMIGREGQRLSKLVNDFLDIQLIEAGRQEYHFQPLDLGAKMEEVRGLFMKSGSPHSFDMELASSLPLVHADAGRLHQVLENLLSNAVKFSPQGGHIVIGARPVGGSVEVWVADSGVGISADDLPRVFDKFYRVKHPMMQVEPGTGLGLSLVKNIVQAHGGRVWAESEVDHGSTFYFTLPAVE